MSWSLTAAMHSALKPGRGLVPPGGRRWNGRSRVHTCSQPQALPTSGSAYEIRGEKFLPFLGFGKVARGGVLGLQTRVQAGWEVGSVFSSFFYISISETCLQKSPLNHETINSYLYSYYEPVRNVVPILFYFLLLLLV